MSDNTSINIVGNEAGGILFDGTAVMSTNSTVNGTKVQKTKVLKLVSATTTYASNNSLLASID